MYYTVEGPFFLFCFLSFFCFVFLGKFFYYLSKLCVRECVCVCERERERVCLCVNVCAGMCGLCVSKHVQYKQKYHLDLHSKNRSHYPGWPLRGSGKMKQIFWKNSFIIYYTCVCVIVCV